MTNNQINRRVAQELENLTGKPTPENEQLVHIETIPGAPITIVGNNENGYFLAFGKHRLSDSMATIELINNYLNENMWNVITNLIVAVGEIVEHMKEIDRINKTDLMTHPTVSPIYGSMKFQQDIFTQPEAIHDSMNMQNTWDTISSKPWSGPEETPQNLNNI